MTSSDCGDVLQRLLCCKHSAMQQLRFRLTRSEPGVRMHKFNMQLPSDLRSQSLQKLLLETIHPILSSALLGSL